MSAEKPSRFLTRTYLIVNFLERAKKSGYTKQSEGKTGILATYWQRGSTFGRESSAGDICRGWIAGALTINAYRGIFGYMAALPKCPHCQNTLSRRQAARMLASLSAGKKKNFSETERGLRREHMKAINARRTAASFGTGMPHRYLNHRRFTLAAIDDVIDRGQRGPWASLLAAVDASPEIRSRVLRVCAAHVSDDFAQRYHFWNNYASRQTTA